MLSISKDKLAIIVHLLHTHSRYPKHESTVALKRFRKGSPSQATTKSPRCAQVVSLYVHTHPTLQLFPNTGFIACRRLSCGCGPTSIPCASLRASWPRSCSLRWRTGASGWSASRYTPLPPTSSPSQPSPALLCCVTVFCYSK